MKKYHGTGEISFLVADKDRKIEEIAEHFPDGILDRLDGITVQYEDFWFTVRKSNTEPLLRLTLEAVSLETLQKAREKVISLLGAPM